MTDQERTTKPVNPAPPSRDLIPPLSLEQLVPEGAITPQTLGVVEVVYTNWEGKTAIRKILPMRLYFGETEYHKGQQFLLECFDVDKQAPRTYAVRDIGKWL